MDNWLKPLLERLSDAINEALAESEDVAKVIDEIEKTDYNIFIVFEVTINLVKRETAGEEDEREGRATDYLGTPKVEIRLSEEDLDLLRAMHIKPEDISSKPERPLSFRNLKKLFGKFF